MSVLVAAGLQRRFGRRAVVRDLHLAVAAGEIVALLGPNGAGKTTTFRMLAGLLRPHGGRVLLGGADVTTQPLWRRARAGLGYLPQEASVFRDLTVAANLDVALRDLPPAERAARRDDLLQRFGLAALAGARAHTLSGGERRRVEILRALAARPRVLLVDEPFAGLDPRAAEDIAAQLRRMAAEGVAVVITDHRVRQAFQACDRVDILADGVVLFSGTPAAAAADARVRALYLGDGFDGASSQRRKSPDGPGHET
ncbi:MAG: LPS export ABC transporter ATP-binding protein [Myxococcales bacterium]|nr:LPS export ABC transporter ATP-binding protein [Myxococcales bacterium]